MIHTQAELFATLMRTTSDYARAVRSFEEMSDRMQFSLQIDQAFGCQMHIMYRYNPQELLGLTPTKIERISLISIRHYFSHPAMPNLEIFWLEEKPVVEDEQ